MAETWCAHARGRLCLTINVAFICMPNQPNYNFLLLFAMHQRCRVDKIDIAGESLLPSSNVGPPSNFSKSADPDESYGNAIVLIILKDALTTITLMLL
jgi:hypothetical protein